jgi:hypothetical protein
MIKVLDKPRLDLTTPIGRGFIAFLSALVEDECQRIVKRNDGRAAVRKRRTAIPYFVWGRSSGLDAPWGSNVQDSVPLFGISRKHARNRSVLRLPAELYLQQARRWPVEDSARRSPSPPAADPERLARHLLALALIAPLGVHLAIRLWGNSWIYRVFNHAH